MAQEHKGQTCTFSFKVFNQFLPLHTEQERHSFVWRRTEQSGFVKPWLLPMEAKSTLMLGITKPAAPNDCKIFQDFTSF